MNWNAVLISIATAVCLNISCSEDVDCAAGCCSIFTSDLNSDLLRYSCQPAEVCNVRKSLGDPCTSSMTCLTKCCYMNRCTSTETCFTYVLDPKLKKYRLWISIGFGVISIAELGLVVKLSKVRKVIKKQLDEEKRRINNLSDDNVVNRV